jgi:membrane associated rhomboid family serine protease
MPRGACTRRRRARFAHIGGFIAGLVLILFMHDRVSHPLMDGHRRLGSWG